MIEKPFKPRIKNAEKRSRKNGTVAPKKTKNDSMKSGEAKYAIVKKQKREDMIEGKYFKCFFSNVPLDPNQEGEPWHHALGRKGALLYDYKNIFPCIHERHMEYHDLSVDKLMKTTWYKDFLLRLSKINHAVYNKELNRLLKGGVIDMETFLKEYK